MSLLYPPIDFEKLNNNNIVEEIENVTYPLNMEGTTLIINDASTTKSGIVNTTEQTFSGIKTFADVRVSNQGNNSNSVTTKNYVDSAIQGLSWKQNINGIKSGSDIAALETIEDGTRYLCESTQGDFTANYIYTYSTTDSAWSEEIPEEGWAIYNNGDTGTHPNTIITFNDNGQWIEVSGIMNYNNLTSRPETITTDSTSPSTGAIVYVGGVGIYKNVYVGGTSKINNTTQSTSTSTGALQVVGGLGVGGDAYFNDVSVNEDINSINGIILENNLDLIISTSFWQNLTSEKGVSGTPTNCQIVDNKLYLNDAKYEYNVTFTSMGCIRFKYNIINAQYEDILNLLLPDNKYIKIQFMESSIYIEATDVMDCEGYVTDNTSYGVEHEFEFNYVDNTFDIFIDGVKKVTHTLSHNILGEGVIKLQGYSIDTTCYIRLFNFYDTPRHSNNYTLEPLPYTYSSILNIAGLCNVTNTTESTSTNTGSLVLSGGASIKKNVYIDGICNITNTTETTSASTGALVVNGGVGVDGELKINGFVRMYGTYNSDSTLTGTFCVSGGVGIAKNLNIDGISKINNTTESTSRSTGALIVKGGMGIYKNLNIEGTCKIINTTESTSTSTGSLVLSGGASITKNVYVNGKISVGNDSDTIDTENDSAQCIKVVNQTLMTTVNDPEYVLKLERIGQSSVKYPAGMRVGIGTFSNTGFNGNTQIDIDLVGDSTYSNFIKMYSSGILELNATTQAVSPSSAALVIKGGVGIEKNVYIGGTLSKTTGSFLIPHLDPEKKDWKLRHCFVESNTRGDNIYRYEIITNNCNAVIELPSYFKYLNENPQVWVSAKGMLGYGTGIVNENLENVNIQVNVDGTYNVLVIGTRKDKIAKDYWDEYKDEIPPQ